MLQVEKQRTRKFELVTTEYLEEHLYRALERRRMPDYVPFLDDGAVHNWLALNHSARFHLAGSLTAFLEQSLPYLAEHFVPELNLVSFGAGDGRKERILLRSLLRIGSPSYYSIDISSPMIDATLNAIADIPVEKTALLAFFEDLPIINRLWCHPALLCLLGNSISTYGVEPSLATVRAGLEPPDLFLFDCRLLTQDAGQLEDAMASPENVRFQTAPLVKRGLEPDAVEFIIRVVAAPTPAGPVRRVDQSVRLVRHAVVTFDHGSVSLYPGDEVVLASTCQYTLDQVRHFIDRSPLAIVEQHVAPARDNAIFMLRTPRRKTNLL
ncbi:MAG: L-histidine N(alpha)-methyltransferase [Candidatus Hydrogenedentes bacterium]|nr:L-histidine N(alpha)-methyltransferase [Candidatus Hydrogenedentota bacterium]